MGGTRSRSTRGDDVTTHRTDRGVLCPPVRRRMGTERKHGRRHPNARVSVHVRCSAAGGRTRELAAVRAAVADGRGRGGGTANGVQQVQLADGDLEHAVAAASGRPTVRRESGQRHDGVGRLGGSASRLRRHVVLRGRPLLLGLLPPPPLPFPRLHRAARVRIHFHAVRLVRAAGHRARRPTASHRRRVPRARRRRPGRRLRAVARRLVRRLRWRWRRPFRQCLTR